MSSFLRLNLGCGTSKIDGYINIDVEKSCKPDLVHDFVKNGLPYKDSTAGEIVLSHTIEHISKRFHKQILSEIYRVLYTGGRLIISYPEFLKCVNNWKSNHKGQKEFWEATLYGRQLYPSDTHVCIMHTPDFKLVLNECGFKNLTIKEEPNESFNTVISAVKGPKFIPYEELLKRYMTSIRVKKVKLSDKKTNKRQRSYKSR